MNFFLNSYITNNVKMRNVTLYWLETFQTFLFCTRDQRRLLLKFIIILFIHKSHIFPVCFERMLHYLSSSFFLYTQNSFSLLFNYMGGVSVRLCIFVLYTRVRYVFVCFHSKPIQNVCFIFLYLSLLYTSPSCLPNLITNTGHWILLHIYIFFVRRCVRYFRLLCFLKPGRHVLLLSLIFSLFIRIFLMYSLFAFIDRHMLYSTFSSFSWSLFRSKCANYYSLFSIYIFSYVIQYCFIWCIFYLRYVSCSSSAQMILFPRKHFFFCF